MSTALVSICIPTYNRANFLKQNLESIVSQFDDFEVKKNIEIVISDNASTDNTSEIVRAFQEKFDNIKYSKNTENFGFDRNLLKVIEMSSGEYCFTLGDDDALFPESLSLLIEKIKTIGVPYFMLNCWGYDHWLDKPILSHPNQLIKEDRTYNNLEDFVKSLKEYLSLVGFFGSMSTQLFSRQKWVSFENKNKYIGTNTIHLFILLSVFKNSSFTLLSFPIVKTRNDNMRWYTYPGLETALKRSASTAKTVSWISDLYNLNIPFYKIKIYFLSRSYWMVAKEFIKKLLRILKLRT